MVNFTKLYNITKSGIPLFKKKKLWRKKVEKEKALLEYRATRIPGIDLSPSQLSMGCRPRTALPIARDPLEPETYNMQDIKARMKHSKEQQKDFFLLFFHNSLREELARRGNFSSTSV